MRLKEYVAPVSFDDSGSEDRRFNAASASLDGLKLKVGQTFEYLFDYGDSWWHLIAVDRIGPTVDGRRYPVLLERHGPSSRANTGTWNDGGNDSAANLQIEPTHQTVRAIMSQRRAAHLRR